VLHWLRNLSLPMPSQMGYWIIALAALLPLHIWCQSRVPGFPIYPAFAAFQFMAFGLPLLSNHPGVISHTPEAHFQAALLVASALCAGTAGWVLIGRRPSSPPPQCLQLDRTSGTRVFLFFVLLNTLLTFNTVIPWFNIPYNLVSVLRGIIGGVSTLALFTIGQYWGMGRLSKIYKITSAILFSLLFFVQISTLLLINALTVAALAIGGFILGSRKIPWVALTATIAVISFLHIGKAPIREAYWGVNRESMIRTLDDLGGMYSMWLDSSLHTLSLTTEEDNDPSGSALDRASLMHLLLFMKSMINNGLPHMHGTTYTLIPRLLIPRFLDPNKPWSQEGTTLLNIHFGLQSREESMVTTIGWGLLNEGFANFGFPGALGICFLIGLLHGTISRLSQGFPFLSYRSLAAILVLSTTFQTEYSMGVFVTVLFQSLAGFTLFSILLMRRQAIGEIVRFIAPAPRKTNRAVSLRTNPKPGN
jgi:hypothetical protein